MDTYYRLGLKSPKDEQTQKCFYFGIYMDVYIILFMQQLFFFAFNFITYNLIAFISNSSPHNKTSSPSFIIS